MASCQSWIPAWCISQKSFNATPFCPVPSHVPLKMAFACRIDWSRWSWWEMMEEVGDIWWDRHTNIWKKEPKIISLNGINFWETPSKVQGLSLTHCHNSFSVCACASEARVAFAFFHGIFVTCKHKTESSDWLRAAFPSMHQTLITVSLSSKFPKTLTKGIFWWLVPLPSSSHHQDYDNFLVGHPNKTFIYHDCILGGVVQPKIFLMFFLFWWTKFAPFWGCFFFQHWSTVQRWKAILGDGFHKGR